MANKRAVADHRRIRRIIKQHQPRHGGKCASVRCEGMVSYRHGCECSKRCGTVHLFAPN